MLGGKVKELADSLTIRLWSSSREVARIFLGSAVSAAEKEDGLANAPNPIHLLCACFKLCSFKITATLIQSKRILTSNFQAVMLIYRPVIVALMAARKSRNKMILKALPSPKSPPKLFSSLESYLNLSTFESHPRVASSVWIQMETFLIIHSAFLLLSCLVWCI